MNLNISIIWPLNNLLLINLPQVHWLLQMLNNSNHQEGKVARRRLQEGLLDGWNASEQPPLPDSHPPRSVIGQMCRGLSFSFPCTSHSQVIFLSLFWALFYARRSASCYLLSQCPGCVNSRCTCGPLGVLVSKWGVVRRSDRGLLSWGSRKRLRHRSTKSWSEVKVCFLLFKGCIRCAYTGEFTPFIHSFFSWF